MEGATTSVLPQHLGALTHFDPDKNSFSGLIPTETRLVGGLFNIYAVVENQLNGTIRTENVEFGQPLPPRCFLQQPDGQIADGLDSTTSLG